MLRPLKAVLAVAWLAGAGLPLAAAPGPARLPASPPAALVEPRAGLALVAGETATLEWAPGTIGTPGDGWTDEWEAFLSVDGGAHYAVRITPHLDRDLRRATFRVPDLPTGDARILLRFGDERREVALELPQRFAIVRPPGAERGLTLAAGPILRSFRVGEPARPGESGVSRWIEGSRRGGETREVEASPPPGAEGVAEAAAARQPTDALAPEPAPDALSARAAAARSAGPPPRSADLRRPSTAVARHPDILLLTRRRNE
jgi:hypothetical protein